MTTIDIQDREELIERLEQTPILMNELVADASEEDLWKAGPGGSLGAVEVLSYLRDFEELFLSRLTKMIKEDNPRFERVEDSLWPIERDYINRDPVTMLQDFDELRGEAIQVLLDLPISAWEKLGRHPSHGQLTVRRYVERVVERDEEYLDHLRSVIGKPQE